MIVCITFIQSYEFGYNIKEKASINADLFQYCLYKYYFLMLRNASTAVPIEAKR